MDAVIELDGPVLAIDRCPLTGILAVECQGEVLLTDPGTFEVLRRWRADDKRVRWMEFSPDGRLLATAGYDGSVGLWDVSSGARVRTMGGHQGRIWAVGFSADGTMLVSAGNDHSARLWSTDGTELGAFWGDAPVRSVALTQDGALIASGDEAHEIRVWDTASGQLRYRISGHTGKVRCLRFAPDGALVSGSSDGSVRRWDVTTGRELHRLQAHGEVRTGKVRSIEFSADHRVMVTGSQDHTARVWTGLEWSPHATLRGHHDVVNTSTLSSDLRWVFTGSGDHTVRRWPLTIGPTT